MNNRNNRQEGSLFPEAPDVIQETLHDKGLRTLRDSFESYTGARALFLTLSKPDDWRDARAFAAALCAKEHGLQLIAVVPEGQWPDDWPYTHEETLAFTHKEGDARSAFDALKQAAAATVEAVGEFSSEERAQIVRDWQACGRPCESARVWRSDDPEREAMAAKLEQAGKLPPNAAEMTMRSIDVMTAGVWPAAEPGGVRHPGMMLGSSGEWFVFRLTHEVIEGLEILCEEYRKHEGYPKAGRH